MDEVTRRIDLLLKEKSNISEISQRQLEAIGLNRVLLRDYQLFGVQWLYKCFVNRYGCILGDEMGLGKTVQVISLLLYIKSKAALNKPTLVVCPLSVLGNWQAEFLRFAPSLKTLCFIGDKEKRGLLKNDFSKKFNQSSTDPQLDVILTTYEICIKESSFLNSLPWRVVVVDEAHRLKNHQSLLYQELIQFDYKISVLMTGTPIQNKLSELYSLLSFAAPKIFPISIIDQFVAVFNDVTNSTQDSSKLQHILQPFLLRRVKSEVNLGLPKKSEVVLFTGMSDLQKKYYKGILLKDHGVFIADDNVNRNRLLNILMQLRKCANHPYLFNGVEPEPFTLGEHLVEASGKLQVIDHLLRFLKKRNHKVLLFSQMVTMLDIIQDYLGLRGYSYERLDGSVRGEERYLAIKNFNETDDTFIFLLSTRAGGVGLNLVSADTVIFVDSDFNPQNDLQAAARAHRIGQTREVRIIRLLARDTVDEIFYKRAQDKLKLTTTVIEGSKFSHGINQATPTRDELLESLKFGFNKLSESDQSEITDEKLIRTLGRTENGRWLTRTKGGSDDEEKKEECGQNNMYVYEGQDYSKEAMEADKKAFEVCLSDLANMDTSERGSRRKGQPSVSGLLEEKRKRKEFTAEELEERRKKREEGAAKRASLKVKKEKDRADEKKRKLEKLWLDNNYISLNINLNEKSDEEEVGDEEDEEEKEEIEGERREREINYVIGDVTRPQKSDDQDAIIVHCIDDSGKWGAGGLFSAVSACSAKPQEKYELAGRMHDLHLGDVHLISLGPRQVHDAEDFVALIVAQTRDHRQRISSINLTALSEGLKKIQQVAAEMKASVHLPRIGYATPSFNWYGTERLIKKHLAAKRTPTFIYYFSRKSTNAVVATGDQTTSLVLPENPRKRKISSLPNIFSDIKVYFHELPEDEKKRLGRYIIAYDGDVDKFITSNTTHIICSKNSKSFEILQNPSVTNKVVVYNTWIEECLRQGQVVDCDYYLVAR